MALDIVILAVLILLNGFFSLSEMAIVSSRRQRLRALLTRRQEVGSTATAGIETAIDLNDEPGRFLSAVQIGITLVGVFAGAFGGTTVAEPLGEVIAQWELVAEYAEPIAFGFVVVAITYFSLIIGELVPKRVALSNPEGIATKIARPMVAVTRALSPAVSLLSYSTEAVLKAYGATGQNMQEVTEEEIKHLVEEGVATGAVESVERDIVNRVLRLGDTRVGEVMRPRTQLVWLDTEATFEENMSTIRIHENQRYPVRRGSDGPTVGMVRMEDLFSNIEDASNEALFAKMTAPLYIPRTSSVLKALSLLQAENKFMAFIVDEYGDIVGTVSMAEIFFALVGDTSDHAMSNNTAIVKRQDGSYLVDGVVSVDEVKRLLMLSNLPGDRTSEVNTLAGVMLHWFERLPTEGDYFAWNGYRFEVADMDGPRIDKVLIVPAQNLPIGEFLLAGAGGAPAKDGDKSLMQGAAESA
ncbi:MAG: hemolysin family protein [Parvibaculaceae bacterium]